MISISKSDSFFWLLLIHLFLQFGRSHQVLSDYALQTDSLSRKGLPLHQKLIKYRLERVRLISCKISQNFSVEADVRIVKMIDKSAVGQVQISSYCRDLHNPVSAHDSWSHFSTHVGLLQSLLHSRYGDLDAIFRSTVEALCQSEIFRLAEASHK